VEEAVEGHALLIPTCAVISCLACLPRQPITGRFLRAMVAGVPVKVRSGAFQPCEDNCRQAAHAGEG
jgi:hypothetical protein